MIRSDFDKVNHLVLPYPRGFDNEYENLTRFFEDLISLVPNDIHQFIIVNNRNAGEIIKLMYPKKNIDTILIDGFNEIWLRDILGFPMGDHIVKPIYKPSYYKNVYTEDYLFELDKQTDAIIQHITGKYPVKMPLILDGGNLITNGDIGIITDKCIRDNTDKSIAVINSTINDFLHIEAVFVETSKNDLLGHSDGYVSFLDNKTLVVSEYPNIPFLAADTTCVNKILDKFESKYDIVRVQDRPIAEKVQSGYNTKTDYLFSARGIYINFLNLGSTIVMPNYDLTSSKESKYYNEINNSIINDRKYAVKNINSNLISSLGGVLRCLSFVF